MNNLEIKRQFFHLFFGIAIVILLKFGIIDKWVLLYLTILGIIVSILSKRMRIPIIYWFLQNFERSRDLENFPGKSVIAYLTGSFLVSLFFSEDTAMSAILILAFGDSISHIFGIHYGKKKHLLNDKKFIEGSIAGFAAAFIAASVFISWNEAVFAAFLAMTAEAIELKLGRTQIDDNISIPIVAAVVITIVRTL